ncbi:MAG: Lrp/AsnC family transcriptional regulator [Halobacteriota archaeon]|nr:Lrp/AsnC family transcriptional regulator [Halobacteriota archaeon]
MIEVLKILEKDAKITTKEIATMTGESESKVKKFIEEMEEKGIIRGYRTVINWEAVGVEYVHALIDLKVNLDRDKGYDAIAERIAKFPEVQSIRLVSGNHDLSVIVKGRTMKDVAYFVAEKIATIGEVRDTVTHFSLKSYKDNGDILYGEEKDRRLAVTP